VLNRKTKRRRFGFSTSEDAVTWVIFTQLLRSGYLLSALRRIGLVHGATLDTAPTLLLWGAPVGGGQRGQEVREQLIDLCMSLKEDPNSLSEPDVVIDLREVGLIFIETKYLSGNDWKPNDYRGWSRYESAGQFSWDFESVKQSGCYELARNWRLLKGLSGSRVASLGNIGPEKLFIGAEARRLDSFIGALETDQQSHFVKATWSDLIGENLEVSPSGLPNFA
jgi:hypothetical protein